MTENRITYSKSGMAFLMSPAVAREVDGDNHLTSRIEWLSEFVSTLQKKTEHQFDLPIVLTGGSDPLDMYAISTTAKAISRTYALPGEQMHELWGDKQDGYKHILQVPLAALRKDCPASDNVVEASITHELGHIAHREKIELPIYITTEEELASHAVIFAAIQKKPQDAEPLTQNIGGNQTYLAAIENLFSTLSDVQDGAKDKTGNHSPELFMQMAQDSVNGKVNAWGRFTAAFYELEALKPVTEELKKNGFSGWRNIEIPAAFAQTIKTHEEFWQTQSQAVEMMSDDFSTRHAAEKEQEAQRYMTAQSLYHGDGSTHPASILRLARSEMLANAREQVKTPDGQVDETTATTLTNTAMQNVREANTFIAASKQRFTDRIEAERVATQGNAPSR